MTRVDEHLIIAMWLLNPQDCLDLWHWLYFGNVPAMDTMAMCRPYGCWQCAAGKVLWATFCSWCSVGESALCAVGDILQSSWHTGCCGRLTVERDSLLKALNILSCTRFAHQPTCLRQFSSMAVCLRRCVMQWFNLFLKGPRILPFLPITMEPYLHPPSVDSCCWEWAQHLAKCHYPHFEKVPAG